MRRLLCILSTAVISGKFKHYWIPAGAGLKEKQESPPARLLIIEADADKPERGALLYRLNGNGECVGDTWHEGIDAAKERASDEYEEALLAWEEVPADVGLDALAIAELGATVHNN